MAEKALRLIKKRLYHRALTQLIQFSLLSKIFFRTTLCFEYIYRQMGYYLFILLLRMFGYPESWSRYLRDRQKLPDYHISLLSLSVLRRGAKTIVDLGCGTGSAFSDYYLFARSKKISLTIIGIDKDFLSLYMAHLFFARANTILLCVDLDSAIPLKDGVSDYLIASGVINYIKNKQAVVNETLRCLATTGVAAYTDVVNRNTTPPGLGIAPDKLLQYLAGREICYSCLGGANIWNHLTQNYKVPLSRRDKHAEESHAYSVFFSHRELPKNIRLEPCFTNRFNNTHFDKYKRLL